MTIGTIFNVATHVAGIPVTYLAIKRHQWVLVLFLLTSIIVMSPTYHFCEDGIWCIFGLKAHTRLDLFTAQLAVTGVIQAMVPYRYYWQELAVIASVFFVQAAVLLRSTPNTRSLQYIVVIISVAPLVLYILYMYARYWLGYESLRKIPDEDTTTTKEPEPVLPSQHRRGGPSAVRRVAFRSRTRKEHVLPLLEQDAADIDPTTRALSDDDESQKYYPYFFYKLFNPRDFLLGLCFGLVGVSLFRLHDVHHTHYDLLHPWWHVFVFIGSYFLYRSAPPRGLGYIPAPQNIQSEWNTALKLSGSRLVT